MNEIKKISNGVNFTVKQEEAKSRLDKFLTVRLKNKTRSQIKKMISEGLVEVDGQLAKVHRFLKPGDKVVIKQKIVKKITTSEAKKEKMIEPAIIFETKDYIVLDKPLGLLIHPTEKGETNTLSDWLVTKYPKIKNVGNVGPGPRRPGIIHRLDKDVSGVMLAVKTAKAFDHLKAQFKNREVYKEYTTLVYGHVNKQSGEINLPIGRNKDGQFVAHPKKGNDKFAEKDRLAKTKYSVLEYLKDYTLLSVTIMTGRTHQIRAHLSAIGHPIIGDQIYKPRKKFFNFLRTKIKVVDPGRIFLHSTKIGFNDLSGNWQEFSSKLPQKLTNFINAKKTK